MKKYNIKFESYNSVQPFSLRIPTKILYLVWFNNEILLPEWVYDRIENIYVIDNSISPCDISVWDTKLVNFFLYEEIDLYLKCESEVEMMKLKLKI